MRTLFIQSYTDESEALIFPLGLAYLATVLEPAHEVRVVDLNLHHDPHQAIRQAVSDFEPEVMGISLRNIKIARPGRHLNCFDIHRQAVQVMRKAAPHCPIIAGGCAFSLFGDITMREIPEIDLGVWGEAEETLPCLMQALDSPASVPGVYYRDGLGTHYTGQPAFPRFAELPWPRRDIVPIEPYLTDAQSLGVQAKRGCALQCLHCSDTFLSGKKLRERPPIDVAREIQMLVEEHGAKSVFFCDQVFNIPPAYTTELCEAMLDMGIKVNWTGWFNERGINDDLVRLCKTAGCTHLSFSPDSVDASVMKQLRKNIQPTHLYETIEVCRRQQMAVTYNFMMNAPGESLRSLWSLFRFIAWSRWRLGRLFLLHGLFITTIRIYPHTELEELARRQGLIGDREDLLAPTFYDPPGVRTLVHGVLKALHLVWRGKRWLRALLSRDSGEHTTPGATVSG